MFKRGLKCTPHVRRATLQASVGFVQAINGIPVAVFDTKQTPFSRLGQREFETAEMRFVALTLFAPID